MQPELVDEFSIDPKQGRFISDTVVVLLLLLGGGTAAVQATRHSPLFETDKKKKEKEIKKIWQAHTHPNIYAEGGAGATLNPPERFLSAASFRCISFSI